MATTRPDSTSGNVDSDAVRIESQTAAGAVDSPTTGEAANADSPSGCQRAAGGAGAGAGAGGNTNEAASSQAKSPQPSGAALEAVYVSTPTNRTLDDVLGASKPWYRSLANVSNLITAAIFFVGLLLVLLLDDGALKDVSKYILSVGLFGFAGGSTNWLAVKMLFDKIPFLYGSGVIPNKFKEIRQSVKDAIMLTFFDTDFLGNYVRENAPKLLDQLDLKTRMAEELAKPEVDVMIATKLGEVAAKGDANGQMLMMLAGLMGGSFEAMVPKLKPLLVSFGQELVDKLTGRFRDGSFVDVDALRTQIDALMSDKLQLLTPDMVKKLLEDVMREHLGWLVLWGNVFGGAIGLISQAVGFGL